MSYFNLSICYMCAFAIPAFFASSGFVLRHRKAVTLKYSLKKAVHHKSRIPLELSRGRAEAGGGNDFKNEYV